MFPLLKRFRRRLGYDEYSGQTIDRLLYSKHVEDLRLIAFICTLAAFFVALVFAGALVYDLFLKRAPSWDFYKVVMPLKSAKSMVVSE
jgi:hypothetical protein